ncbi:MAG TPA: adenylate/guanylate cyclase domain-containing protein [Gemmatimonadota bacterium]|nr:adenylate/guanylate cyclase domain-containing protein [Gemmatimonadota bacterium]
MAFAQRCPGGAEIELSMLFVDVRGSTRLAEGMTATEFGGLMNRFYKMATDVLIESDAVIDKLVGDAVIGFYLPLFTGPNHARPAVLAARRLLEVSGHGADEGPWIEIGVGVHAGTAFVGTVGGADGTVSDITALGDNVNVGARLASMARPGEILVSEAALAAGGFDLRGLELRRLELKGKSEPIEVRVIRTAASMPS